MSYLKYSEPEKPVLGDRYELTGIKCFSCDEDFIYDKERKVILHHECGELPREVDPMFLKKKIVEVSTDGKC
ncbi:hypothetical protein GF336_00390 [Candidatus Woesearchaeota archaeon]|nr:hypothetical protein [Candidatus Woesearchaeota archaeon]